MPTDLEKALQEAIVLAANHLRVIKTLCAGLYHDAAKETLEKRDAGAAWVHVNNVLYWIDGRVQELVVDAKPIEPEPVDDGELEAARKLLH